MTSLNFLLININNFSIKISFSQTKKIKALNSYCFIFPQGFWQTSDVTLPLDFNPVQLCLGLINLDWFRLAWFS